MQADEIVKQREESEKKSRKSIEICIIPEGKVQRFYSLHGFLLDVFSGKRYNHFIRYRGAERDFGSSCIVLKGMI